MAEGEGVAGLFDDAEPEPTVQELKAQMEALKKKLEEVKINDHLPATNIEKYKGKLDKRDFNTFLKEFYSIANMYGWSEAKCCRILPVYLLYDAAAAYETIPTRVKKDWKELVNQLARKLGRADDLALQRRSLHEMKQGPLETALEFCVKIQEAVKRAYPDTKEFNDNQRSSLAVDHFINGLRPELQDEIMRAKPNNITHALELARMEESIVNRKRNNTTQNEINRLKEQLLKMNQQIVEINAIQQKAVNALSSPNQNAGYYKPWNGFNNNYSGRGRARGGRYPNNQRGRGNFRGRYNNYHNGYKGNGQYYYNNNNQNANPNGEGTNANAEPLGGQGQNQDQNGGYRGQYRGRGGYRGRARGRGGYGINELAYMPIITFVCIFALLNMATAKEYKICPQPRSGYLLSWPMPQNCEKDMAINEEIQSGEVEIYVPRTAPVFIPGFKCVKEVTKYCTKRIFRFIDVLDWTVNSTEAINKEECWIMANNGTNKEGKPLKQINADFWESENEAISPEYAIFGTKCVNSTKYKLQLGTVGSMDGQGMVSELEEISRCKPEDGHCTVENSTIVWPKPNSTTFCSYENAGKFSAFIAKEYVLVDEIQAAFIEAEGEIPAEIKHCVPEKSKMMENEVVIKIISALKREKREASNGASTSKPIRTPPPARTSSRKQSTTTSSATMATSRKTTAVTITNKPPTTTIRQNTVKTSTQTVPSSTPSTQTSTNTPIMPTTQASSKFQSPFDIARGEEAFFEYFRAHRPVTSTLGTVKFHNALHLRTPPPPVALGLENAYRQGNNEMNSRMQYGTLRLQNETKSNFNKLWRQICRLHNFQVNTIRSILKMDVKEGIRLWLNRNDITAIHNGEAILVAPCTAVKPRKIHWSHQIGEVCYEFTPVQIENMTLFIIPGSDELSLHSPNISCKDKPIPAFLDSKGEWRTEYGKAQVANANQHLILQTKQSLIKFRSGSIFNSDLHRISTSIAILESYAKRINQKLVNIPKMSHFDDTSGINTEVIMNKLGSAGSNIINAVIDGGSAIVNVTSKNVKGIFERYEKWSKIIQDGATAVLILIILGGILYTYPYWAPLLKCLCPRKRKAITVNAIRRGKSEESFQMLDYFPPVYAINLKEGTVNTVNSYNRSKKAHVNVKINGQNVQAMIDSGSEISYCRLSVANGIGLKINKKDTPCAITANRTTLPFVGSVTAEFKYGDYAKIHSILVSSDQLCPAPMLLGTDLADDIRCNFKEGFVTLDGITMPMLMNINLNKTHKVYVPEKLTLAPHSDNFLYARTNSRFPASQDLLVSTLGHNYKMLLVGKATVRPGSTQIVPIRLLNTGNKEIIIYPNSNIGKLEEINEQFEPKQVFNISNEPIKPEINVKIHENCPKTEANEDFMEHFPDLKYLDKNEKLNELDLTDCALSEEGKSKLLSIIRQNHQAFVKPGEIGSYNGPIDHQIHLIPGSTPTCQRPYRVPMGLREEVERQIKELLEKKVIRPSTSAFCAPIVLVKKKDGSYRMAIDYRKLNKATVAETYIMPLIQDILDMCGGKKLYATFDFKMGFTKLT